MRGTFDIKSVYCPECGTSAMMDGDTRHCNNCGYRLWVWMDDPWEEMV